MDNILLLPLDEDQDELFRSVLLIDYNSVWSMEELTRQTGIYYSIKDPYSAPEVRLREIKSVCHATDLYSVCVIFMECVQEKRLRPVSLMREIIKPLDGNTPMLKGCPFTVLHKVNSIIGRGLTPSPDQRFQSIEDMQSEFRELLNRIDGIGITLSALWEASARGYRTAIDDNSSFSYVKTAAPFHKESIVPTLNGHQFIIGNGGMGKTTVLINLWRDGIQRYDPQQTVPVYVPLYKYQSGSKDFIKRSLLEKLKFDGTVNTVDEMLCVLKGLLDNPIKSLPSVLLLLDGLNEIGGRKETLFYEIEELAALRGTAIVLTSRTENNNSCFEHFRRVKLLPLKSDEINDYLVSRGLLCPSEENPWLGNPLMLYLYTKTCELLDNNSIIMYGQEEILPKYLETLLSKTPYQDEDERIRARFAIEILLPHIAMEMKNKGKQDLTLEEILEILETWNSRVSNKIFLIAFSEYAENASAIFGVTEKHADWFRNIVHMLLVNKLALLWVDENSNYHLPHENFRDYLSSRGEKNNSKFRKVKFRNFFRRYVLVAALLLTLLTIILLEVFNFSRTPEPDLKHFPPFIPSRSLEICVQSGSTSDIPLASELIAFFKDNRLVSYNLKELSQDSQIFLRISRLETSVPTVHIMYPELKRGNIYDYEQHKNRDIPMDKEGKQFLNSEFERLAKLYQLENMQLPEPNPALFSIKYKLYSSVEEKEWETISEDERLSFSNTYWKLTRTESVGSGDSIKLKTEEKVVILEAINQSSQPYYIYGINATPGATILPFLPPVGYSYYSTEVKPGENRNFKEFALLFEEQREYVRIIASVKPFDDNFVDFIKELASDSNDTARGGILVNDDIIPKETVSQFNFFLRD